MPIQAPQWTDYLNCPVCCREFGPPPRSPISLGCGHTLCGHCLKHLHRKQCPFDQTVINADPEELVVNTALLQLAGYTPPAQPYHPPSIQVLSEHDRHAYDVIVRCLEHLAIYLKLCGNANNSTAGNRLSRPMQRKLVTLLQCAITDEEGRGRAARAARSLGERTVTELILQHQNPQQLSANLWAAVRARGCQFLGPAMQEEVLKLVLLALEDGSALSRKVLVMFVVQRLEPHFPQASKTSIGHVVQLLYRASCFKVSKRECDSSLMQLKEEFRTYELLRREHDAQIVQIATEAGLRIAPDQWSALLYGDTAHKSHMQSIIDKLQTPQSFAQSVQELFIALQRTGDPAQLVVISMHLDRLANIDASPDAKSPTWQQLAEMIKAIKEVVSGLIHYLQQQASGRDSNHNQKHILPERCIEPSTSQPSPLTTAAPSHKYKTAMCRDAVTRSYCPRGNNCTFAHYEEELERFRAIPNTTQAITNGNYTYMPPLPPALPLAQLNQQQLPQQQLPQQQLSQQQLSQQQLSQQQLSQQQLSQQQLSQQQMSQQQLPQPLALPMYPRFPMPPPQPRAQHQQVDTYNIQAVPTLPTLTQLPKQPMPQELLQNQEYGADNQRADCIQQPQNYASALMHNQAQLGINQNSMIVPIQDRPYYGHFGVVKIHDEPTNNIQFPRQEFVNPVFQGAANTGPITGYPNQEQAMPSPMPNIFVPVQHEASRNISPYTFDDPTPSELLPDYRVEPPAFASVSREHCIEPTWPNNSVFNFDSMRTSLPHGSSTPEDIFAVPTDRRAVGADRIGAVAERMAAATSDLAITADDEELEEELQALERRIDTEFKSTD